MQPPLALVLDDDSTVRERAKDALVRAGIEAVAVATPQEALDLLRAHPLAVVVAVVGDAQKPVSRTTLLDLCRLRADDGGGPVLTQIQGRSQAADELRRRVLELAASRAPVVFSGEVGSGRRHAARCLHALSNEEDPFVVVPSGDRVALDAALDGGRGTVFVSSIEQLPWPAQEALAAALAAGSTGPRVAASIGVDPHRAADEGRLSKGIVAAFSGAIVPVPPLRERRADIAVFVRAFIEELRTLNRLPPIVVAPDALAALERFGWPGNLTQLRGAVEAAVMLASDGTVRLTNLPEHVVGSAVGSETAVRADRRFREAKRLVVDAFERSYLEDLLKRNGGNVTGAAEQSGMLRSALQRLLRKHEIHSADFRALDESGPYAT
jgi:DNA-binding NtrC family response regulator